MYTSSQRHIHDPVLSSQDGNYTCINLFFFKDVKKSVIRNLVIVFFIPEDEVQFAQSADIGSNEFRSSVCLVGGTGESMVQHLGT